MTDANFHLLLVDGLNVVRRVYEANPAPDSDDKAKGAVKSSLSSLRRALRELDPTHALLAFDAGGHTWRHALYDRYREGRKPMPEPLRNALPSLYEQLRNDGWATRCIEGVEADDVIVTAAHRVQGKPFKVTVLSTDKDLLVLLRLAGVQVRDHFKPEWRDVAWCEKKFGVGPALLADYLALMGDAVDGIPGVEGVGQKTAAKLLLEHGGLEAVLQAAEAGHSSTKGKLGEKLRAQAAMARLSRQLVGFKTDIDLGIGSCAELRVPVFA